MDIEQLLQGLRQDMQGMEARLLQEVQGVRQEVQEVRQEIQGMETRLHRQITATEDRLGNRIARFRTDLVGRYDEVNRRLTAVDKTIGDHEQRIVDLNARRGTLSVDEQKGIARVLNLGTMFTGNLVWPPNNDGNTPNAPPHTWNELVNARINTIRGLLAFYGIPATNDVAEDRNQLSNFLTRN